jgi:K+ transporter
VLWTVAIVDGAAHFVSGDLITPALMAVAAVGGVSLIAVRARRTRQAA